MWQAATEPILELILLALVRGSYLTVLFNSEYSTLFQASRFVAQVYLSAGPAVAWCPLLQYHRLFFSVLLLHLASSFHFRNPLTRVNLVFIWVLHSTINSSPWSWVFSQRFVQFSMIQCRSTIGWQCACEVQTCDLYENNTVLTFYFLNLSSKLFWCFVMNLPWYTTLPNKTHKRTVLWFASFTTYKLNEVFVACQLIVGSPAVLKSYAY